jgi:sugar/nucleoside kinase (ribokinase family)
MNNINKKFDVVVVGAVGIDTNVYFYTNHIDFDVEGNFTENIDYVGQAGGYASKGFAQLGYKTAYIGTIGNDSCGNQIREDFLHSGINIEGLRFDPKGTKRSINFMYPNGNRKNFYDGKGHMDIEPDLNLCKSIFSKSTLAHFNLMNWSRKLLPIAKDLGVKISCDLQDIVDINDPYREDFIKYADFLFFSTVNFSDPSIVIKNFQSKNSNPDLIIIVGMGKKGCVLATRDQITFYESIDLKKHPIIDTNGAGDELAVGFLSSYLFRKDSLENSIMLGQICARYTCSIKASTSNLITKNQLETFWKKLRKNPIKKNH